MVVNFNGGDLVMMCETDRGVAGTVQSDFLSSYEHNSIQLLYLCLYFPVLRIVNCEKLLFIVALYRDLKYLK